MNSKSRETSDPDRLLLNLRDKVNLKRSHKYVTLSNLRTYLSRTKIISLKHKLRHGMKSLNYLMDHILYQMFKIILRILLKKTCRKD